MWYITPSPRPGCTVRNITDIYVGPISFSRQYCSENIFPEESFFSNFCRAKILITGYITTPLFKKKIRGSTFICNMFDITNWLVTLPHAFYNIYIYFYLFSKRFYYYYLDELTKQVKRLYIIHNCSMLI